MREILHNKLPVIYEDENLLALDKPAGLLTIPAPGKAGRSLQEILDAAVKEAGLPYRLHPCHRLDEETSGVVLFAKGKSRQKRMMELFRHRDMEKVYIAYVQGCPRKKEGSFTRSLEGLAARTDYRVLEQKELFAVVETRPLTGRKNQIRLHFKAAGHPLVGETRFAFRRDSTLRARRLMLHAVELSFVDPWTGEARTLRAPLPADMLKFRG